MDCIEKSEAWQQGFIWGFVIMQGTFMHVLYFDMENSSWSKEDSVFSSSNVYLEFGVCYHYNNCNKSPLWGKLRKKLRLWLRCEDQAQLRPKHGNFCIVGDRSAVTWVGRGKLSHKMKNFHLRWWLKTFSHREMSILREQVILSCWKCPK